MFSIEGKKAFVSGASRGLGRQFANALANAGADVAVTSRTLSSLEGTNKEIETAGSKCVSLEMNVLNLESIQDAVNKAEQELGEIDILINNVWNWCDIR